MKIVYVEVDRCIACLSCERACLFHHAEKDGAEKDRHWSSNIFVNVDMDLRKIYAGTCLQCETALCMLVCPVNAVTRTSGTGAVVVDKDVCIGCGMCVMACPFGYMLVDEACRKATKCDLCGGDPKCVQMCMARALHFGTLNSLAAAKRGKNGVRLGLRAFQADGEDFGDSPVKPEHEEND